MNTPVDVSARLKRLRAERGLSQAAFAKELSLSRGLYNGLETGREKASEWVVKQLDMLERLSAQPVNTSGVLEESSSIAGAVEKLGPGDYIVRGPFLPQGPAGGLANEVESLRERARVVLERHMTDIDDDKELLYWLIVELGRLKPPLSMETINRLAREEAMRAGPIIQTPQQSASRRSSTASS